METTATIELDTLTKAPLEKLQVLIAYATSEANSADQRLTEVRDEIEALTVDTKRRLKSLIEEKGRLEAKSQSNKSNAESLFTLFKDKMKTALITAGVPEDKVSGYQCRIDSDFNIVSVFDGAATPKE